MQPERRQINPNREKWTVITLTATFVPELREQHGGTLTGPVRHDGIGLTVGEILARHATVATTATAAVLVGAGLWSSARPVPQVTA